MLSPGEDRSWLCQTLHCHRRL